MKSFLKEIFDQYKEVYKIFVDYLKLYGGIRSVLTSPYFHFSIALLLLTSGIWLTTGWWDLPTSILPSLISITLAGYALFLAIGDEKFRELLAGKDGSSSPLLSFSATFSHFIVLQTLSMILAIFAKSRPVSWFVAFFNLRFLNHGLYLSARISLCHAFWSFSFLIFIYSMMSIIAISMSLFRISRWLNTHHVIQMEHKNRKGVSPRKE